jgi:hypothetical protein
MVKIAIVGKSTEKINQLKQLFPKYNIQYTEESPDIVISQGGDGMFLISERVYPHIPKVLIRDSKICNNCTNHNTEYILDKISKKEYTIQELPKLKAIKEGSSKETRELIGVNDIVLRNHFPTEAIRFKFKINNNEHSEEMIGDGLVIATPFGSNKGGYFNTITRKKIENKIGVAFNNVTSFQEHFSAELNDTVEIIIARGQGILVADNNRDYIPLNKNDKITIFLHNTTAKIIKI